jgi:hypothetical protein
VARLSPGQGGHVVGLCGCAAGLLLRLTIIGVEMHRCVYLETVWGRLFLAGRRKVSATEQFATLRAMGLPGNHSRLQMLCFAAWDGGCTVVGSLHRADDDLGALMCDLRPSLFSGAVLRQYICPRVLTPPLLRSCLASQRTSPGLFFASSPTEYSVDFRLLPFRCWCCLGA